MKYAKYILTGLTISICLLAVISAPRIAAQQTNFNLTIEPLACVVDITALGSIASSSIAPKECEKAITPSPAILDTPNQAVTALLRSPLNGQNSQSGQNETILSLTYHQPVADQATIASVTTSNTIIDDTQPQFVAASMAAVIGAAAVVAVDGLFFGFTSLHTASSGITKTVRTLKSGLGKLSK